MIFDYQVANAQGEVLHGQVDAADQREALRLLQQQNLRPITLEPAAGARLAASGDRAAQASPQDTILAIQELTTLLHAGVPLAESVESISAAHAGTAIGHAFGLTLAALKRGDTFAVAITAAKLDFPPYLYQLAAAGELTGKLADSLETAMVQMQNEERTRQELRNALTYPAILILSGIAATMIVFLVVVPRFANLLKGNASIPLISRWVIGTGMFVQAHAGWVALGAAAAVFAAAALLRNPTARRRGFELLARLPLVGPWIVDMEMGRWASMLGALLGSRVAIIPAMELAASGVRIPRLRNSLQQVMRDVRGGSRLADALVTNKALGPTGVNLVRVGERSGELSPMLRALAQLHENAGRDRMKRLLLLLEPVAIILIGSVIGVIMVAILLAVTSLNDRVG
jgi:general secretion pathway protein F